MRSTAGATRRGLSFFATAVLLLTSFWAAPATAAPTYVDLITGDSPDVYYRLNEASGTTAADSSPNNRSATYFGTPLYSHAGAVSSNSDSSIGINNSATVMPAAWNPTPTNTFTELVWFKTTSSAGGLLAGMASGDQSARDRLLYVSTTGAVTFGVYTTANQTITSPGTYLDGTWHMAAATLSTAGMKLYMDGKLVASNASITTAYSAYAPAYWRFGTGSTAGWPNGPAGGLVGDIDEPAIWNSSAQSATQIAKYFDAGKATMSSVPATTSYDTAVLNTSPSLYYRMGETSGTSAADSSGYGRTGTYAGTPALGQPGAIAVSNDAAIGVGANDYIQSSWNATPTDSFSVQVWFRTTSTTGGRLIGMTNSTVPASDNAYDRFLWMTPSGNIKFGVYPSSTATVKSTPAFNDGLWHMATGTLGPTGQRLYVDGTLVASNAAITTAYSGYATSYWRVGNGYIGAEWGEAPTGAYVGGLDEATVWEYAELTPTQITALWDASRTNTIPLSASVNSSVVFTVGGRATVCNGQSSSNFQTATATAANLGRSTIAAVSGAAQDLSVSTNASNGFVVSIRTASPTPNPFRDTYSHSIADVSGSQASPGAGPVAGTPGFGYTSNDTSTPFTLNTWAKLSSTPEAVLVAAPGVKTKSGCVGFQVAVGPATYAGLYTATVVYSVVPTF